MKLQYPLQRMLESLHSEGIAVQKQEAVKVVDTQQVVWRKIATLSLEHMRDAVGLRKVVLGVVIKKVKYAIWSVIFLLS